MPNIISIRNAENLAHEAANNFASFEDELYLEALQKTREWAWENIGGEQNLYPPIHGKPIASHINASFDTPTLKQLKNFFA